MSAMSQNAFIPARLTMPSRGRCVHSCGRAETKGLARIVPWVQLRRCIT